MSDFEERLRAADPAAQSSYEHPDPNAMISRIMAQAPRARRHVLRSFQLRMAGSVAVAAALTVGGIAALEGASPNLAVFALAATQHRSVAPQSTVHKTVSAGYAAALPTNNGPMRVYEEFDFSAGPDLSASEGSGAAYEMSLPTSAKAEDARLATIFGVSGTPVDTNSDGQDFTVTDATGDYVDYETYDTVPQWSYSVAIPSAPNTSSTTSEGVNVAMPSQDTVNGDVQSYLGQMGYGYQVTDPQFSESNNVLTSPGQPTVTTNEEQATYGVTADGVLTDQSLQITVDQNNNLVSASGPAFSVMPGVSYPLQSPAAGVEVLEAAQQAQFASSGSGQSSGSGPSTTPLSAGTGGSPATPPSTTPDSDTTTTTLAPPIVDVTLDAETISYETFQLTDGSVWMLPIYNYTGLVTNADGSSYTGTWSTIAVDPTYIQVSTSSSGGINPGGPILY
jgi:hypothetical protein